MSWADIKHAINSTLGTAGFKPLNAIMKNEVDRVMDTNLIQYGSAVKSIQRGTTTIGPSSSAYFANVTISTINPSKSVIIVNGWGAWYHSPVYFFPVRGSIVSATQIRIEMLDYPNLNRTAGAVNWQVIEYY